eukprot:gene28050-31152_t
MSGQPGSVVRVACCTDAEKEAYPEEYKKAVETWIAPNIAHNPTNDDRYTAYNKPEAVIDYLKFNTPEEEYVLVLDSDMILRRPFLVEEMHPAQGLAIGAKYAYMIGVNNELAIRHIPEVAPRNDTLAGPVGRRGDQVGGFFFIHCDDLKRMSTLWLKYTEDVRFDDMAYKYSGDVYAIHPGDKPWISEMYGYAFGAAKADVWHRWDTISMLYPSYEPAVDVWHQRDTISVPYPSYEPAGTPHQTFCIPFPHSLPQSLAASDTQGSPRRFSVAQLLRESVYVMGMFPYARPTQYYKDLLSIETVATINAGLCDFHLSNCPPSQQLYEWCNETWDRYIEVVAEIKKVELDMECSDTHDDCVVWAQGGQCKSNEEYMSTACLKACHLCETSKKITEGLAPASLDYPNKLAQLLATLNNKDGDISLPGDSSADKETTTTSDTTTSAIDTSASSQTAAHPHVALKRKGHASKKPPMHVSQTDSVSGHEGLKVKCYRSSLPVDEVKACVEAAKKGNEYPKADARKLSSDEPASTKVKIAESGGQKLARKKTSFVPFAVLFSVSWVGMVLFYYVGIPILGRLVRKPKSGMRSE